MSNNFQNRIDRINSIIEFNEDNDAIRLPIYIDAFHAEFIGEKDKKYYLRLVDSEELLCDNFCFVLNDWKYGKITEVNFKDKTYSVTNIVVAFVEIPEYNQCFEFDLNIKRWRIGNCSVLKSFRVVNNNNK